MSIKEQNLPKLTFTKSDPFSGETPFQRYRRFELVLKYFRAGMKEDHHEDMGLYEDDILNMMDIAWHQLTDEERAILNAEGPQTWPEK